MLTRHSLTTTAVADAANSSVFIARELFMPRIHRKDEPNSFFMTSPHSIRKTPAPVQTKTTQTTGTGSTPYPSENPLSSQNLAEPIDCIGFPASCQRARSASLLTVDDAIAVLVC